MYKSNQTDVCNDNSLSILFKPTSSKMKIIVSSIGGPQTFGYGNSISLLDLIQHVPFWICIPVKRMLELNLILYDWNIIKKGLVFLEKWEKLKAITPKEIIYGFSTKRRKVVY